MEISTRNQFFSIPQAILHRFTYLVKFFYDFYYSLLIFLNKVSLWKMNKDILTFFYVWGRSNELKLGQKVLFLPDNVLSMSLELVSDKYRTFWPNSMNTFYNPTLRPFFKNRILSSFAYWHTRSLHAACSPCFALFSFFFVTENKANTYK